MKIHRLYADKDGESHFQDVEVEYAESTRAGRLSKRMPATGIIFREVQPDYDLDWHPAPRRQYIINLDAGSPDHGKRRRVATHRRRRSPSRRGHARQGTSLEGARRQAAELYLRHARIVCATW